jgi:predicted amidohydrolase
MRSLIVLLLLLAAQLSAEDRNRIRVGLFTAMPVKWDLEANWKTFQRTLEAHAAGGIDLVVTPECFLDGYAASAKDWSPDRFEKIGQEVGNSPYLARVRTMARKHSLWILFGYTEKRDGKFYNAALLIDREGRTVGQYYKTHLQNHDLRFTAGTDLPVFETPWGKVGILICADRRWPETARVLRLKGARLILLPSYGMWHIDNEWWMRTRSYENENFLAFAHPSVAFVADPKGGILAKLQSNVPGMLVCDVDLSEVSEDRHIRDRRPELYKELSLPR